MRSARRSTKIESLLLDTCVVIDHLRARPVAVAFVTALEAQPAVCVATVAEVLSGLRSQKEAAGVRRFFASTRLIGIDEAVAIQAGNLLRHYRASHGLDLPNAIIAATAEHLGLKLATLNVKHYPMFPRLKPAY